MIFISPLTIITKRSILNVAAVIDPTLASQYIDKLVFRKYEYSQMQESLITGF